MKLFTSAIVLAAAMSLSSGANAQDAFPSKDITIIVQYAAGGGTDNFVRALEQPLEEAFGVNVGIRNVAGGGGAVGMQQALAAEPDGYTVTIPNNAFYTLVGMGNVGFTVDSFDYIAALVLEPYVLAVHKSDRWADLDSFLEVAKEEPMRLGFSGVGSSTHIMAMAFAEELGIEANFVPFGGGSEATASAMGGHIEGVVLSPADLVSALQGDEGLIPLVSTGPSSLIANVPTFEDLGYNLTVQQWRGIAGPSGIPQEVKDAWQAALEEAIQDPAFIEAAKNIGTEISPLFGEDLQAFVDEGAGIMVPLTEQVAEQ